ncbi:MAG: purine phosphoribosyltransferase family protein [Candidatus Dadabacteria bacterium]|nr:purine phosphoribosyltransferase family protein [Candidatus Dadabacteria bacterium]
MTNLPKLRKSLEQSPIVKFGEYPYFVHPIADGVPGIQTDLLEEITDEIEKVANLDCDIIVTPEAMGIPVSTALSLRTGLPLLIVRKRRYGLADEVEFCQDTGYSSKKMYINGLKKGDRVLVIDDIVSTGGTLRGMIKAMRGIGVSIADIVVVIEKGEGKKALEKDLGVAIKTLVKVEVRDGRVVVID